MEFIDWAATILGAMLIFAGVRAIRRREAHVPDRCAGGSAIGRLAMDNSGQVVCLRRDLGYCTVAEPVPSVSEAAD
ncbi:hypothetical protein IVG45_01770 [Methylomonas sp. LL1]|uniref:hypothetical protein n=1 Tax=Methylomonas sp. LL1 TaxID=2785785 RepID=UPI0018C39D26|nr:hypothetical protein [Methylomonas sp. LL1]QPK63731.1 hypothetical protein IVG45_01770 [Methylomonas sp. LL1]